MFKSSDIKSNKINLSPFLYGVLFSRIIESKDKKWFILVSSFKQSKKTNKNLKDYIYEYINKLNLFTKTNNKWISYDDFLSKEITASVDKSVKSIYVIQNDLFISKDNFLKLIFFRFINENFLKDENLNEHKKDFLRGFWELRGSVDISAKYISQDYFYENSWEIKRVLFLFDYLNISSKLLNINFRELQNQYVNNVNKRNTQIRINLYWYLKEIGIINDYKKHIITDSNFSNDYKTTNKGITFFNIQNNLIPNYKKSFLADKVDFYINKILYKELSESEIKKLRSELNFDNKNDYKFLRNHLFKTLCRIKKPNFCSGCKNEYDLNMRTFIHLKTNEPYFEIHHNIPLSNGQEYDVYENLVKLCPVCHKQLTKGIAYESEQKKIIFNILINNSDTLEYSKIILKINDINEIVNKIYSLLK